MERYEIIRLEDTVLLIDLFKLTVSAVEINEEADLSLLQLHVSDAEFDEIMAKAKIWHNYHKKDAKLAQLTLIVTYNCNFACQYCYQRSIPERNTMWSMPEDYIERIFEICADFEKYDDFTIRISGGEPLLLENKPLIERILQLAQRNNYKVKINTNGYTLTEYAPLINNYSPIIKSITSSLDGMTSVQSERRRLQSGEFYEVEKIIDGLKAVSKDIDLIINTTIDEHNLKDFDQIMTFIKEDLLDSGLVSTIRLAPGAKYQSNYQYDLEEAFLKEIPQKLEHITQNWSKQDRKKIDIHAEGCSSLSRVIKAAFEESDHPVYPESGCTPANNLTFDPYGEIYLCDMFLGTEEGKLGRYYPDLSFNENYYKFLDRSVFTIDDCKNCKYSLLCGSKCPYIALYKHGNPLQKACTGLEGEHKEALLNSYLPFLINTIA